MGYIKDKWLEEQERGWYSVLDMYVCANCVNDDDLKQLIADNADHDECSYCGETAPEISASLDVIIERIVSAIKLLYEDYEEAGFPWPEDEYSMEHDVFDSYDVLQELPFDVDNEQLFTDVLSSIQERQWTNVYAYFPTHSQELTRSWDAFEALVKKSRRYTFLLQNGTSNLEDNIPPIKLLASILSHANEAELIKQLEVNVDIFRARIGNLKKKVIRVTDIGTAPAKKAIDPNRMSPAGIPMFYGASDIETCFFEIYEKYHHRSIDPVTIGRFNCSHPLRIIDLSSMPAFPGIFSERNYLIEPLKFLEAFSASISKRIRRDGREHIEYVPTQIITEYIRFQHLQNEEAQIDGIVFNSSLGKSGKCYVLFFENHQCMRATSSVPKEKALLLKEIDRRKVSDFIEAKKKHV